MNLCSIASSSSGNCIYVGNEKTHLLIDIGLSCKKLEQGLEALDINPKALDGVLITHEHSDHIKGLGVLSRKHKIPIYATKKTWNAIIQSNKLGKIDVSLYNEIIPNSYFNINDIEITAFNIPHDAIDPVCYNFISNNKKISIATDLGCYNDYIIENLKGSHILFLESNHDKRMLEVGNYPYYLKRRILSDVGHLSNDMAGNLIRELIHEDLAYVLLGHLSKENNHEAVAYETVKGALIEQDYNFQLIVAAKSENSPFIML